MKSNLQTMQRIQCRKFETRLEVEANPRKSSRQHNPNSTAVAGNMERGESLLQMTVPLYDPQREAPTQVSGETRTQ